MRQKESVVAVASARKPLRSSCLLAGVALGSLSILAACATQEPMVDRPAVESYTAGHPPELRRITQQVPLQGERNRTLNQMRSGLAAMEAGHLDLAAASFDDALRVIETIYADNPAAERARSVWYSERAKDFKGEPYERAMAYYYRGLLYLMQGDYQNARASFRGGLLQDSYMEENQRMASDFGALAFLEGWAGRCAGFDQQTVAASFDEARRRNPALTAPSPTDALLVLFEAGTGPSKMTAGSRNEVLRYAQGMVPPLTKASFTVGGQKAEAVPAEDLFFQAATRSGRWIDAVNQGKVVYQTSTRGVGQAATAIGAGLLAASAYHHNTRGSDNMAAAGAAILLVGLIAQAASEAMKTEADARQWDNLPANILLRSMALPAGSPAIRGKPAVPAPTVATVQFERAGQARQRDLPIQQHGACAIAWGREISALSIPDTAPNTTRPVR